VDLCKTEHLALFYMSPEVPSPREGRPQEAVGPEPLHTHHTRTHKFGSSTPGAGIMMFSAHLLAHTKESPAGCWLNS
jgi:hypothetical protein